MLVSVVSVKAIRNSSLCDMTLSTGECLSVHTDVVLKYRLSKGTRLDEMLLKSIVEDNSVLLAKRIAYRYAAHSPRTTKQVADKLKENGISSDYYQDVFKFLKEFGLLDDEDYARKFIQSSVKGKPISQNKLKMKLFEKGISKEIIDNALELFYPHEDKYELALKAAEKKMRMLSSKPIAKQKPALMNYLYGQGYESDMIRKVVERLLGNSDYNEYD